MSVRGDDGSWSLIPGFKILRELFEFTQLHIAICLDVSPKQVYLWENRGVKPHIQALADMCVLFNCELDDLVHPRGLGPPPLPE